MKRFFTGTKFYTQSAVFIFILCFSSTSYAGYHCRTYWSYWDGPKGRVYGTPSTVCDYFPGTPDFSAHEPPPSAYPRGPAKTPPPEQPSAKELEIEKKICRAAGITIENNCASNARQRAATRLVPCSIQESLTGSATSCQMQHQLWLDSELATCENRKLVHYANNCPEVLP